MHALILVLLAAAPGTQASRVELTPPSASASMAVVAFGHCDDLRLGQGARELREELSRQRRGGVLSEDASASPAGGLARSTLDEIRRAIDAVRTELANLGCPRAEARLRAVLPEIERLPPGPDRWGAASQARLELARVYLCGGKRAEAAATLFEILRLQGDLEVDPHRFPQALGRAVDEVRGSALRTARRHTLRVTSREPSQRVFIDGREVGRTPFERALAEGSYGVVVGDPEVHGFERKVMLHGELAIAVDVAREARFKAGAGPCYEVGPSRDERLAAAALVGGALSVDQLVAVRLERQGDEDYLAAGLLEVARGRELLEGRQRLDGARIPEIERLAGFLLTD